MTTTTDDARTITSTEILEALLRAATAAGPAAKASVGLLLAAHVDLLAAFDAGFITLTDRPDGRHATVTDWWNFKSRVTKPGPVRDLVETAQAYADGTFGWLQTADGRQVRAVINAILVGSGMTGWFRLETNPTAPDELRVQIGYEVGDDIDIARTDHPGSTAEYQHYQLMAQRSTRPGE